MLGPLAGEMWLVLATQGLMGQCEVDLGVAELLDSWSAALADRGLLNLHDLYSVCSGTHISVCRD